MPEPAAPAPIGDLMEALRASVVAAKKPGSRCAKLQRLRRRSLLRVSAHPPRSKRKR